MAVLIRGAEIFDGGGGAPFFGDVLVRGEKIEAVGPHLPAPPDAEVLDAKGRMLCPGFIDIHRHADVQPLVAGTRRPSCGRASRRRFPATAASR